jgi:hypothetical protein
MRDVLYQTGQKGMLVTFERAIAGGILELLLIRLRL